MKRNLSALQCLLKPLGWIYGLIIYVRNIFYDKGILPIASFPVPVISVGNITVGGTGKTPFVISLAKLLQENGYRIGIVTRGYRRKSRGQVIVSDGKRVLESPLLTGDEPYLVARQCSGAVIIADADRVRAVRTAVERYHCELIIADDAFQHRRLGRDRDILLWDPALDPAREHLLPAGNLREPLKGVNRAWRIVIPRREQVPEPIRRFFGRSAPQIPLDAAPLDVTTIRRYDSQQAVKTSMLRDQRVLAFCGLGNPDQFFETVRELPVSEIETLSFPDHHRYTGAELEDIINIADLKACSYMITTEKDTANLPSEKRSILRLLILGIRLRISDMMGAAILRELPPPVI